MRIIPSHVQIETVNRLCNARCPMCTIKFLPETKQTESDVESHNNISRRAEFMSLDDFMTITKKMADFVDNVDFLSLFGCGEPLMDPTLPEKVKWAKEVGFKEVSFTSNCGLLTPKLSSRLLKAGLNCIIPSIDGTTSEVHEAIRPRLNFNKIIANVKQFIERRNEGNYECKVLVRMIRQQLNYHQWDEYLEFWGGLLNSAKGDRVLGFNIHNTGGKVKDYDKMKVTAAEKQVKTFEKQYSKTSNGKCPDLFGRLSIFASGDVALCSADQAEFYKLGNVIADDPIDVFNGPVFREYREKWDSGEYKSLKHCRDCTIFVSRFHKTQNVVS